jgi:cytochrome oxidase Cu insertion factor (SCO1/SenC/PrrC family)
MKQGNSLSHNLRTLVIDPQGRLYRQYNDNLWTADQLAQTVTAAASRTVKK